MALPAIIVEQSAPSATTWTDLYTVGAGRRTRICVRISNRDGSTADICRVAISKDGAAIADEHWVFVGSVAAVTSVEACRLLIDAADVIRIYSTQGTTSFTITGYEDDQPA